MCNICHGLKGTGGSYFSCECYSKLKKKMKKICSLKIILYIYIYYIYVYTHKTLEIYTTETLEILFCCVDWAS